MGLCLPFSEIDIVLAKKLSGALGCIVDTSFLISVNDSDHDFHADAQFLFEKLVEHQVPLYVSVSARAEFIDFQRRVTVTEILMDMLAPTSKWKISAAVREVLKTQRGWVDREGHGLKLSVRPRIFRL